MTVAQQIADLIAEGEDNYPGALSRLQAILEPNSSWQRYDSAHAPSEQDLLDLVVQRREGPDLVRAVVRGARVKYPRLTLTSPVFYAVRTQQLTIYGDPALATGPQLHIAVETDGWYVVAFAVKLSIDGLPPTTHTDP